MRGVLIIIDGLGDLDNKALDGKTCLESANIPNLNFLASYGELGLMYPVKQNFIPESDEAIVSIFGNKLIDSTRGQLEAIGSGLELKRGDLALRVNFATIDSFERGNILDRRAGRTLTTSEAKELSDALNKIKLSCKFEFVSTIQHRAALVLRGGFSDNISVNDLTYTKGISGEPEKISFFKPLDDDENSEYTANILNEFLKQAYLVLKDHPVNVKRKESGLLPANYLLMRGAGIEKPKLKQYKKWVSANYMPLEIGFSKVSGMKNFSFNYPKLKNLDCYKNLYEGLRKACKFSVKFLKRNYKKADYAYIHLKEVDVPGHDNKPIEKKEMLEYIDKTFFKFLKGFAISKKINIVVTGDHSTPCKLKNHSADPVPVLFFNNSEFKEKKFNEKEAENGSLGKFLGKDLFKKVEFK
ncbi:MAG: alkaline phosphatase family protein [Candidatus Pacearchaeota archaeon]|jgi:2,3-bisphosphoglycerate-independent phosphoglycerate mutase